jgi:hypothetical protein
MSGPDVHVLPTKMACRARVATGLASRQHQVHEVGGSSHRGGHELLVVDPEQYVVWL